MANFKQFIAKKRQCGNPDAGSRVRRTAAIAPAHRDPVDGQHKKDRKIFGEDFDAAKANKEHAEKLKKMAYEASKKAQLKEEINRPKDPPMMLILRRQAIRNYPNNERVALYSNPQLKIQLAVPYDYTSGALKASNMLPIKEEYIHPKGERPCSKCDLAYNHERAAGLSHQEASEIVRQDHEHDHQSHPFVKEELLDEAFTFKPYSMKNDTGLQHAHHNGKRIGFVYHNGQQGGNRRWFAGHSPGNEYVKAFGSKHEAARFLKGVKEDSEEGEQESKEGMIATLTSAYEDLQNDSSSELDAALFNWLTDEINEHGDFEEMPDDILDDVYEDYMSLITGSADAEDIDERVRHERKVNDYADWHELANRRGDASFKIHNAGNTTSAFRNGKHIGSFHHDKKSGALHESMINESWGHKVESFAEFKRHAQNRADQVGGRVEFHTRILNLPHHPDMPGSQVTHQTSAVHHHDFGTDSIGVFNHNAGHQSETGFGQVLGRKMHEDILDESPVMRINNIMKRGEEGAVDHHNGGSSKVHPKTANVINGLLSRVNQGNREKLGHLINASPEGLRRVVAFANELVGNKPK